VAILANNPLYGLKSTVGWVAGRFAPTDPKEKAVSEAGRLNQAAADLVKSYEVGPKNSKLMLKALTEYQVAIYNFTIALSKINASGTQGSDDFAALMTQTIAQHTRFIDEMSGWKYLNNAHQALLRDISDRFGASVVATMSGTIGAERFETLAGDAAASAS